MNSCFVTATDTEAGKTVITGLLAGYLAQKNLNVITQKWLQTGTEDYPPDIETHLKLMGKSKSTVEKYLPLMQPYGFKLPASPHLAAKQENAEISPDKIKNSFRELTKHFDFVIVEGIGGALVPYSDEDLVIDIAAELGLPSIMVVNNKLGAINHTLLTVEALKNRNMEILGIIFNQCRNENPLILKDNIEIVEKIAARPILGTLPWSDDVENLRQAFAPIGEKFYQQLKGQAK